jgi:tetratricopeptide (TPR) repeat protein
LICIQLLLMRAEPVIAQSSQNQNPLHAPDTLRLELQPSPQPTQDLFRQSPNTEEQARLRQQRQLNNTARQFEFMGQNDRALGLYKRILDMYPDNRQAFDGLLRNLVALGRYTEIEVLISERLRDPASRSERPGLLADLGSALYKSEQFARADSVWSQALAVSPVREINFQEVANVQLQLHLLDRSIETYLLGREVLENPSAFSINLANLYTGQMNWVAASVEYLRVLRDGNRRVHYVRRGLANFPDTPAANAAVTKTIESELNETRNREPWDGHRITLHELLIDQRTKNGDFAGALETVADLDELEHGDGNRLLRFASETLDEGFEEIASDALDIAAERLRDPEGIDVVDLMRAQVAESRSEFAKADSLFTVIVNEPASSRVERSALMSRGLIRLQNLDQPAGAVQDFRIVRELGWPDHDRRLDYYEALALVRIDSLDAALIPLQRQVPASQPDHTRSLGFETEDGLISDADLIHLAARITMWQGDRSRSSALLDSVLNPPVGAPAENETLMLLHLITTTEDSLALNLFAEADYARFRGDDEQALSLLDSLGFYENTPEQLAVEAGFSAALLRLEQIRTSEPIAEFANRHPGHPRVEEAWYLLGNWWETQNNPDEALIAYEMVLLNFPDGLLQAMARLRLEELTLQLFLPVPQDEES